MSRDLDAKLAAFDRNSDLAVDELLAWVERDRTALIALARGRHVEGHYRYRDGLMYEYGQDELKAEASQEVADAINYLALRLERSPRLLGGSPGGAQESEIEGRTRPA